MPVALLLALIRLTLAAAGVAGSILRGVDSTVALVTFAVGTLVLGFALISSRQGMLSGRDVRVERPWRAALAATYPSTIGLTVLTAVALAIKPQLASLLAGILAGLGLSATAVAAQIAWARR